MTDRQGTSYPDGILPIPKNPQNDYELIAPSEHEDRFIIPVEWQEYPMRTTTIKIKQVTKLRCDCGQEVKR